MILGASVGPVSHARVARGVGGRLLAFYRRFLLVHPRKLAPYGLHLGLGAV